MDLREERQTRGCGHLAAVSCSVWQFLLQLVGGDLEDYEWKIWDCCRLWKSCTKDPHGKNCDNVLCPGGNSINVDIQRHHWIHPGQGIQIYLHQTLQVSDTIIIAHNK